MRKKYLIYILMMFCLNVGVAQGFVDSLDLALKQFHAKQSIPGFGVLLLGKETDYFMKGYGYQNLEDQIPYTENTVQNIGSISKTLIAVALMSQVEKGRLNLDDNINDHLDFEIKNPFYSDEIITIRHLATHTSSLLDGVDEMLIEKTYLFNQEIDTTQTNIPENYLEYIKIYNENRFTDMRKFILDAYTINGKWYEEGNFCNCKPGAEYNYSNLGSTVLAYILEQVSGMPYSKLVEQVVFQPLHMTNSYWSYEGVKQNYISTNYLSSGMPLPRYRLITYPDGGLITSLSDFSLYIREMLKGAVGEGSILSEASFKEIFKNQLSTSSFQDAEFDISRGLFWYLNKDGDNITANGADPGISSYLLMTTAGNAAMYIMMNKSIDGNDQILEEFKGVRSIIFEYVGNIIKQYSDENK